MLLVKQQVLVNPTRSEVTGQCYVANTGNSFHFFFQITFRTFGPKLSAVLRFSLPRCIFDR